MTLWISLPLRSQVFKNLSEYDLTVIILVVKKLKINNVENAAKKESDDPCVRRKTKPKIPDYKSVCSLPIHRKDRPSVDSHALAKLIEEEVIYVKNLNTEGNVKPITFNYIISLFSIGDLRFLRIPMVPKLERDLKSMPSVDFKNYMEKWKSRKTSANSRHKALVDDWSAKVYAILRRREERVAETKSKRRRNENLMKQMKESLPESQWETLEKMFEH